MKGKTQVIYQLTILAVFLMSRIHAESSTLPFGQGGGGIVAGSSSEGQKKLSGISPSGGSSLDSMLGGSTSKNLSLEPSFDTLTGLASSLIPGGIPVQSPSKLSSQSPANIPSVPVTDSSLPKTVLLPSSSLPSQDSSDSNLGSSAVSSNPQSKSQLPANPTSIKASVQKQSDQDSPKPISTNQDSQIKPLPTLVVPKAITTPPTQNSQASTRKLQPSISSSSDKLQDDGLQANKSDSNTDLPSTPIPVISTNQNNSVKSTAKLTQDQNSNKVNATSDHQSVAAGQKVNEETAKNENKASKTNQNSSNLKTSLNPQPQLRMIPASSDGLSQTIPNSSNDPKTMVPQPVTNILPSGSDNTNLSAGALQQGPIPIESVKSKNETTVQTKNQAPIAQQSNKQTTHTVNTTQKIDVAGKSDITTYKNVTDVPQENNKNSSQGVKNASTNATVSNSKQNETNSTLKKDEASMAAVGTAGAVTAAGVVGGVAAKLATNNGNSTKAESTKTQPQAGNLKKDVSDKIKEAGTKKATQIKQTVGQKLHQGWQHFKDKVNKFFHPDTNKTH